MPKAVRDVPPPLEMLCLNALWRLKEAKVEDVRRVVADARPLAYTTIMTVLERLVRKGKVARRKQGRAHIYFPTESREALRRVAVRELVDAFFDGSEASLAAYLGGAEAQPAAMAEPAPAPVHAAEESIETALL